MITIFNITILFATSTLILYPLSKYLAFGNNIRLNDLIHRINNDRIKESLLSITYFKLFSCRPCITFWLTLFTGLNLMNPIIVTIQSLITYLIIKYYDKEEE